MWRWVLAGTHPGASSRGSATRQVAKRRCRFTPLPRRVSTTTQGQELAVLQASAVETGGGGTLKFYDSTDADETKRGRVRAGGGVPRANRAVGMGEKNARPPPFREADVEIRWGVGI